MLMDITTTKTSLISRAKAYARPTTTNGLYPEDPKVSITYQATSPTTFYHVNLTVTNNNNNCTITINLYVGGNSNSITVMTDHLIGDSNYE